MRLDELIQQRYSISRSKALWWIQRGVVTINGILAKKGGLFITDRDEVLIEPLDRYVSFGGYKLEQALHDLCLNVADLSVLDIGSSTGGFIDCLLQHGAKRVIGVDVGSKQCHPSLAEDKRVLLFEKCDIRSVNSLPFEVDLITVDLSFCSTKELLPKILLFLKPQKSLLVLLKPQFECGSKKNISKKGNIKREEEREKIKDAFIKEAESRGLCLKGKALSLEKHADCNREEFLLFVYP